MDCPTCGAPMVSFVVPERFREHAPDESDHAALCPECLTLSAADSAPESPRFDRISSAFPDDEAAVSLALAIGLLDSLALHRRDIEALLETVEKAGTDPLLILDRLHAQGGVDPEFDIERRRHQIEQLLD
ncbi:hypothetical protein HWV23_06340 [Natronomonas halophila]|uniref:DUF6276 family protein n=1 Tax=Natronomonas halophila TaxID=2747817 RepID=UPI0015B4CA18|nr:DUF6276 family protein [Natronomonas halophila]QLD85361.1 hypothetical protein HWV23_06340 [Natronomonas halophila]